MRSEAEEKLFKQIEKIRSADADAMRDAAGYVQSLAAPPGSLGKLTDAAYKKAIVVADSIRTCIHDMLSL